MLFKIYKYYEMNEDGIIEENDTCFITVKETVDIKKLEKKLGTVLKEINSFDYDPIRTEFTKFMTKTCRDRFSNSLPTFVSFDSDVDQPTHYFN